MKAGVVVVTVMAVALGGAAMAAESDLVPDPVAVVEAAAPAPTDEPGEDATGDAGDPAGAPGGGLECGLVPAEGGDGAAVEGQAPAAPEHSFPAEGIECSGTGNERSAEVALVPRTLAHSDEVSGAERGAAISEWAKTHANRKTEDAGGEPAVDEGETSGDVVTPATPEHAEPASPGRSGEAPGRAGSRPGDGRGR